MTATQKIVVVGGGPAAWKFCKQLRQQKAEHHLTCISEESLRPYNRVQMGRMFSEGVTPLLYEEEQWYAQQNIEMVCGDRVQKIDRNEKLVVTQSGKNIPYNTLVLATGSSVAVPPIEGLDHPKVVAYRNASDVARMIAEAGAGKRVSVLGGGLLGLEAAWELSKLGMHVEVIERGECLMPQYLDASASQFLADELVNKGIDIHTATTVQSVSVAPSGRLRLHLDNEPTREADLLVLATGIRPRDELAREAGIEIGPRGGVLVDEGYRSSDDAIYAIGECASVSGRLFGLVAPVMKMAEQLAMNTAFGSGNQKRSPITEPEVVHLKLGGLPLTVIGEPQKVALSSRKSVISDCQAGTYQSLNVDPNSGQLLSAICIGENAAWQTLAGLLRKDNSAEQAMRFLRGERGDPGGDASHVSVDESLVGDQVLCHCEGITVAEAKGAIRSNPQIELPELSKKCGVGQGCGTCLGDFQKLYQSQRPKEKIKGIWGRLLTKSVRCFHLFSSLAAAIFLLFFAVSGWAMNHSDDLGLDETIDTESEVWIAEPLTQSGEKLALIERMRALGARGAMTEFDRDEEYISIAFQSAGRYFEAEIDLTESGDKGVPTAISTQDSPFLETLGEIHRSKGHEEGETSLFIDLMAYLMGIVSLSGIALFFRMASRKNLWILSYFVLTSAGAVSLYFYFK